jgi:hypothetical protein
VLERFFSIPMIGFALMVLPLLAVEYYWAEQIREEPLLRLWFDIGTSVVWLAFSVELIVMVSVSDRPWRYCLFHWIDVAIVLLPLVEMLPLFRLLRLGRLLRLDQLLRWGRLHRLQALATRGWRALLLLRIVQRLTARSPEHRLEQLRDLLRAKEEEAAELREEIVALEAAGTNAKSPPRCACVLTEIRGRQPPMLHKQIGQRRGQRSPQKPCTACSISPRLPTRTFEHLKRP